MQSQSVAPHYFVVRAVGSLWFAAVLLVLLLVALACATVYESTHSTERALIVYYRAWWFTALLGLLSVNVLAALVVRFPINKWKIGFVLTHSSILLILGGALVTRYYAQDGQLALVEGQTSDEFVLQDRETLTVLDRVSRKKTTVDLNGSYVGGLRVVEQPATPTLEAGDLKIQVERYVPDIQLVKQMRNDNSLPRPAVELSLAASETDDPRWVFANQRVSFGSIPVILRVVDTTDELSKLLQPSKVTAASGKGRVRIEYKGQVVERPVEQCLTLPIAVADTGLLFRVLRFFPHATVGADNKITNSSDEPINPAIEVEIAGADGVETRLAFAKFPNFSSMHGNSDLADLTLTYVFDSGGPPPGPSVEILRGPAGALHVRLTAGDGSISVTPTAVGEVVDTPWPGRKLVVHRSFDHARLAQSLRPVDSPRKNRSPGLLVRITTPTSSETVWLERHRPLPITVDQKPYELSYAAKTVPLGFALTLDSFKVGYYPGEMRPRSFESRVTITDAAGGRSLSRVISMNNPANFGRYSLYQSSYQLDGTRRMSILSVSRDPGQLIVFAGYILMIGGMIVVLITRTQRSSRELMATAGTAVGGETREFRLDLMHSQERCNGGDSRISKSSSVPLRQSPIPSRTVPLTRNKTGAKSQ